MKEKAIYKPDKKVYGKYSPTFIITEHQGYYKGITEYGRFKRFEIGLKSDWEIIT